MKKMLFLNFIEKYHLSGLIESVKWVVKDNTLDVRFVTDDMVLLGQIKLKNVDIDNTEFGIYTTSELLKMFSAMDLEINAEVVEYESRPVNLLFTDEKLKSVFILSDPEIIPKTATPKKMPDFNVEFDMTLQFINRFIRSKNAVPDATSFAFQASDDELEIIIGYSDNNTNRISWKDSATVSSELLPTIFNAEYFKNVLTANKNMSKGKLSISSEGLLKLQFLEGDYTSEYFMVQI